MNMIRRLIEYQAELDTILYEGWGSGLAAKTFPALVTEILDGLTSNLETKSKGYKKQVLAAIFLMNNYYFGKFLLMLLFDSASSWRERGGVSEFVHVWSFLPVRRLTFLAIVHKQMKQIGLSKYAGYAIQDKFLKAWERQKIIYFEKWELYYQFTLLTPTNQTPTFLTKILLYLTQQLEDDFRYFTWHQLYHDDGRKSKVVIKIPARNG